MKDYTIDLMKEYKGCKVINILENVVREALERLSDYDLLHIAYDNDALTTELLDEDGLSDYLSSLDGEDAFWLGVNSEFDSFCDYHTFDGYGNLQPVYDPAFYVDKNYLVNEIVEYGSFADFDASDIMQWISDNDERIITSDLIKEFDEEI